MEDKIFNEKNKYLVFMNKIHLPHTVLLGDSFTYLNTISSLKRLFVISKSINNFFSDKIKEVFDKEDILIFEGEPSLNRYNKLRDSVISKKYDCVIGIGGGSILDLVKSLKKDIEIKVVLIPTTPATGSESSPYSTFIDEDKKKIVFNSRKLLSDVVVLDVNMLKNLPYDTMGYSIIDILAHSLEALVSKLSNPLSESFALGSIKLIFENYYNMKEGEVNFEAIKNIQIAGFLGGLAQGMASVGIVHAFAHYFGPKYNIRHSRAICIFLRECLDFNMQKTDKYSKLNELKVVNKESLLENVDNLIKHFNIDDGLNVEDNKINKEEVVNFIIRDICTLTNPVRPNEEEILSILNNILKR